MSEPTMTWTSVADANRAESRGATVDIAHVSKTFPDPSGTELKVLDDVSIRVEPGEFVALVGPSGCGKTTLLRMVEGLESVETGSIDVTRPTGASTHGGAERLGFVFQRPALLPWRTVEQNVRFGLSLRSGRQAITSATRRAEQVEDLLRMTGLTEFRRYYPTQISGGMQQRVNLARALAINPSVLLLDEPFSALDSMTRDRLQREVSDVLFGFNTTVVLVTHDIREAVFLADRIIVLSANPGRIREVVEVDQPRPRDLEFQLSTELVELTRYIWDSLHGLTTPPPTAPAPAERPES